MSSSGATSSVSSPGPSGGGIAAGVPVSNELAWRQKDPASYYMYYYKTVRCVNCKAPPSSVSFQHNDKMCDELGDRMGGRRNPLMYKYSEKPCPVVNETGQGVPSAFKSPAVCPKDDACPFVHTFREMWYHPAVYKTEPCKQYQAHGRCSNGDRCARYHEVSEIRHLESSAKEYKQTRMKYKKLKSRVPNHINRMKAAIFGKIKLEARKKKRITTPRTGSNATTMSQVQGQVQQQQQQQQASVHQQASAPKNAPCTTPVDHFLPTSPVTAQPQNLQQQHQHQQQVNWAAKVSSENQREQQQPQVTRFDEEYPPLGSPYTTAATPPAISFEQPMKLSQSVEEKAGSPLLAHFSNSTMLPCDEPQWQSSFFSRSPLELSPINSPNQKLRHQNHVSTPASAAHYQQHNATHYQQQQLLAATGGVGMNGPSTGCTVYNNTPAGAPPTPFPQRNFNSFGSFSLDFEHDMPSEENKECSPAYGTFPTEPLMLSKPLQSPVYELAFESFRSDNEFSLPRSPRHVGGFNVQQLAASPFRPQQRHNSTNSGGGSRLLNSYQHHNQADFKEMDDECSQDERMRQIINFVFPDDEKVSLSDCEENGRRVNSDFRLSATADLIQKQISEMDGVIRDLKDENASLKLTSEIMGYYGSVCDLCDKDAAQCSMGTCKHLFCEACYMQHEMCPICKYRKVFAPTESSDGQSEN